MKIATVQTSGGPRVVRVEGDGSFHALAPADVDMRDLLAGRAIEVAERVYADAVLAPLRPGKIVAIGLNYLDHVRESGMDLPGEPLIFTKFTSSVIGTGEPIIFDPSFATRVDWEVELAVVIGRAARDVAADDALSYVFGYTVANDVSARDLQLGDGQWVRGKSLDTFCPLGPWITTADEVLDPQALSLTTRVDGELVQDSSTGEMIFSVAEIIAFCSRAFTLEVGDVILTGTPWGCGEFATPRRSLKDGEVVEVEVGGLGMLSNRIIAPER